MSISMGSEDGLTCLWLSYRVYKGTRQFCSVCGGLPSRDLLPALLSDLRNKKPIPSTSQMFSRLPRAVFVAVAAEGTLASQVLAPM